MYRSLTTSLPSQLLESGLVQDLAPGRILYRRGESALRIYLVERGRLCLYSQDLEGHSIPLYVVRPQEFVSEAALFADVYCSDVVAELPSTVRAFPKQTIHEALQKSPSFSEWYMAEIARRFDSLRVRLELRSLRSARARVLQYLMTEASGGEATVSIDRPLKSLAEDVGLAPESFYRALSSLASEGLLSRTGRTITLLRRLRTPACLNHTGVWADSASM